MDAIIQQWDCAALRYMQDQECSEYVRCNKALVQARFPGFSGERVLDLSCGYGCYTDYFRAAGADAIGIDGSEKMIELARADIGVFQCGYQMRLDSDANLRAAHLRRCHEES